MTSFGVFVFKGNEVKKMIRLAPFHVSHVSHNFSFQLFAAISSRTGLILL